LITVTGWTWEYINEYMTLPRLYAMDSYWESRPPTHMMVAAYLGIKKQPKIQRGKIATINPEWED
jgi:hypothetical protein